MKLVDEKEKGGETGNQEKVKKKNERRHMLSKIDCGKLAQHNLMKPQWKKRNIIDSLLWIRRAANRSQVLLHMY